MKSHIIWLLTMSLTLLVFASGTAALQGDLVGTQWELVSFGQPGAETPVIPDSNVTLNFQPNNQVEGNGGCNGFGGSYTVDGVYIVFNDIVSTLMACADEAINEQEQTYLEALQSATRHEISGSQLTIWYDGGQLNFVSAFQPTDRLEGSQWALESYGDPNAPTPVIAGSNITLNFVTTNQIEGNGGCNSYSGNYQNERNSIAFSQIIHTEIACADPVVTQQEQAYFDALQSATQYEGLFDRLLIFYPGGQLNFVLTMNETTPVPPFPIPEGCPNPWVVQFGDTLSSIARACNTTVAALLAANPDITDPSLILVGQEITIPDEGTAPPTTEVPPFPLPQGCATTYTVQAGDTLFSIAEVCNTTVNALLAANPEIDDPTQLEAVQVITIPISGELGGQIALEQTSAAPGAIINVSGTGFEPTVDLDIGFGPAGGDVYQPVGAARTTNSGSFRTTVTIPETADPDDEYVFVALDPEGGRSAPSPIFDVTPN